MITFRDFMETSLYDKQEGFYSRRIPTADFYTAPELHPAFAETLAGFLCKKLTLLAEARPTSQLFIMEIGSGNGTLAHQVLTAIAGKNPHWINRARYVLVERVEHLLMDSIVRLQNTGIRLLGYTQLEEVPPLCGVAYSNELIDAMPVHVLEKRDGRVREVYVDRHKPHAVRLGLLSQRALVHAARALSPHMEEGERHAVNLDASAWIKRMAVILKAGTLLTIDYGKRFSPATPNPPRTFYRHTVGQDITGRAGRQDLTASADFSQLIAVGEKSGLRTAEYQTLGKFLLANDILSTMPAGDSSAAYQERTRIKTLFHPEGMGESFKVLIQEKGN